MIAKEEAENIEEAKKAMENNNLPYARALLNKTLKVYPTHHTSNYLMATIERNLNHSTNALDYYSKLMFTENYRRKVILEMGKLYFKKEKYSQALECFEDLYSEALYAEDNEYRIQDLTYALKKSAEIYTIWGNYEQASKLYKLIVDFFLSNNYANNKEIFDAYTQLGHLSLKQNYIKDALSYFNLAVNPQNQKRRQALLEIAKIYYNEHELQTAQNILTFIIKKTPNSSEYILDANLLLLKVYAAQNKIDKALKIANLLLETNKKDEAWQELIFLLFKQEEYKQIVKILKRKKIRNPYIHNIYSISRLKLSKTSKYSSKVINLYENYSYNKILSKLQHNPHLNLNDDISHLLSLIKNTKLIPQYYYGSDIYDHYIIPLSNIGVINYENTDFIHVTTLVNTTNIVNVEPCYNLNGICKQTPLEEYTLTLQK